MQQKEVINIQLYDYQKDIIKSLQKAWRDGYKRPCIVLPCGGGKSIIASEIAKRTTDNGGEVMFLVHRRELREQIENTFTSYGVDMDKCTVNMIQTASRHAEKFSPKLIITDENHHCLASSYQKIYDLFPSAYCVGLTATPCRLGGGGLGKINDKLIIGPTVKQLICRKKLAPFEYYAPVLADVSKLTVKHGEYSAEEAEILLDKPKIYGDVIKYYNMLSGKKAICYCSTVRHSKTMAEQFKEEGIPAEHIDGNTPTERRGEIIQAFREGKIKILCNVDLISEGFDVPDCQTSILLRPTKSLTLFIQQSMRCMRYQPDKRAVIIDHVGNVHRHGLPDTSREWTLEPKAPKKSGNIPQIKQCPQCFYVHTPAAVCPNCGHAYQPTKEELKQQREAELVRIVDDYQSPMECTNIKELYLFAKLRGYKPGYAYYQAKLRRWL